MSNAKPSYGLYLWTLLGFLLSWIFLVGLFLALLKYDAEPLTYLWTLPGPLCLGLMFHHHLKDLEP